MTNYISLDSPKSRQDGRKCYFWAYWLGERGHMLTERSTRHRAVKDAKFCTVVFRSTEIHFFHHLENRPDDEPSVYEFVDFAIAHEHKALTLHIVDLGDYDNPETVIPPTK